MKHYFTLRKSRMLLLVLLASFVGGVSPAWADGNGKALPYRYGFETEQTSGLTTVLTDEGWTLKDCDSKTTIFKSSPSPHGGKCVFKFYYHSNPNLFESNPPQYLITPEFETSSKTIDITFWYRNPGGTSYTETFNVGYSTTNAETGSFTWLDNDITAPTSWTQYVATFPAGTKFVAIKYTSIGQYGLYIDDFKACYTNPCAEPTDLTVSNITAVSVDLSWTSDANQWNIQYKKKTDADWTDVSGTVNTNSYTLTGLESGLSYEARVRTYCDENSQSDWTETVSFTLDCAIITSFPFYENFNSLDSYHTLPLCWDNSEGTTSPNEYSKWYYQHINYSEEGNCLRFDSYHNETGNTNMLKTPVMNFPSGKTMQLSFLWMNPNGGSDLSVYISNDGGSTYTQPLKTGLTNQDSWKGEDIIIPSGYTENVVIVFKGTVYHDNYVDHTIFLDDVVVREAIINKPQDGQTILSEGFESNSLETNGWTASNPGNQSGINIPSRRTGTYGYQFDFYTSGGPRYLISPLLSIPANASDIKLSFYYKRNSDPGFYNFNEKFKVGYSTTTNDLNSFTWGDEVDDAIHTDFKEYINTSLPLATKYIAIQYCSGAAYFLYIDDISLTCNGTTNVGTLELNETENFAAQAGSYGTVTLNRTYNVGWNTICLPFGTAVSTFGTNAKAYAFTGYENGALQFSKVTTLTAGTPYLLYLDKNITAPISVSNVTVVSEAADVESNNAKFQGAFSQIAAPGMNGKWGVTAAGKIGKGNASAFINGFRAYFELPDGATPARLAISEEGISTVINDITTYEGQKNAYNLNGQRVETIKKGGLYIINDKKQVVK